MSDSGGGGGASALVRPGGIPAACTLTRAELVSGDVGTCCLCCSSLNDPEVLNCESERAVHLSATCLGAAPALATTALLTELTGPLQAPGPIHIHKDKAGGAAVLFPGGGRSKEKTCLFMSVLT